MQIHFSHLLILLVKIIPIAEMQVTDGSTFLFKTPKGKH